MAEWDFIVVGSGFGGSVSALRLVEKGYRVLMLEKGRRLRAGGLPEDQLGPEALAVDAARSGARAVPDDVLPPRHRALRRGRGRRLARLRQHAADPEGRASSQAASWARLADWKDELRAALPDRAPHARAPTPNPLQHRRPDQVLPGDGPARWAARTSSPPTWPSTSASRTSPCRTRTSAARARRAPAASAAAAACWAAASAPRTRSTRTTSTSPRSAG